MKYIPFEITHLRHAGPAIGVAVGATVVASACGGSDDSDGAAVQAALVEQGRQIFRFDTFGDEAQWTDTLRMHEVIAAAVDPVTALSVGLDAGGECRGAGCDQTDRAADRVRLRTDHTADRRTRERLACAEISWSPASLCAIWSSCRASSACRLRTFQHRPQQHGQCKDSLARESFH